MDSTQVARLKFEFQFQSIPIEVHRPSMEYFMALVFATKLITSPSDARVFCSKTKIPLEVGHWTNNLQHMDSAVVENRPVGTSEGQVYVYENYFPGHTINYIHVDNVAIRSCGASATIKKGGIGSSSVLIVLHAETNEEIRTVIDIWGTKNDVPKKKVTDKEILGNMKSLYLFKGLRTVNHNKAY